MEFDRSLHGQIKISSVHYMSCSCASSLTSIEVPEDVLPITNILVESGKFWMSYLNINCKVNKYVSDWPLKPIVPDRSVSKIFMSILIWTASDEKSAESTNAVENEPCQDQSLMNIFDTDRSGTIGFNGRNITYFLGSWCSSSTFQSLLDSTSISVTGRTCSGILIEVSFRA